MPKSVLRIGVDKDHRTSKWVLILYQILTTIEMNCRQELKIVYVQNGGLSSYDIIEIN